VDEASRFPAHLTTAEYGALGEFLPAVRSLLGADLIEIRLFGSRARGERQDDSDLDVALVVSAAGRVKRYEVYDLAFDIQLKTGVALAPLVIEKSRLDELRERERLLAQDLDREGISL
jgi:predicted nucleotidyltransferase